jgi:hypothetical protein
MTNNRVPHFILQQPVEKGAKRMSVVSIMATILEDELREHGIVGLTQLDCETMVRSMIERTAELGADIIRHRLEPHPREQS